MLLRASASDVGPSYGAILAVLLMLISKPGWVCSRSYSSDSCDWVGSGANQEEAKGVQPIYLRCTQGRILWHYPQGALRVVLRLGTSGKDFLGCLRVAAGSSGARIYLEGRRRLYPIFTGKDGTSPDLIRCFTSYHGQVALYVEANHFTQTLSKDKMEFSYDLQHATEKSLVDEMEECRPCTEEEILRFYCISDFVVQGTVSSLYHNTAVQRSELTLRATKVLRDSHPPLWNRSKYATVHRPLKCGTKVGSGEFVFLGRWMLGNPVIRCAPRLVEWKKIRRKSIVNGTNQCQLS